LQPLGQVRHYAQGLGSAVRRASPAGASAT
jgi:hypothetical protein